MLRYKGGDTVKRGFYASMTRWTIEMIEPETGELAGEADERYFRVPVPVMLVAAPLMGAAFVIFLPFIGFVLLGKAVWTKMAGRRSGREAGIGRRAA
jgi:hypothetical protein